jgi:hypothetical protein
MNMSKDSIQTKCFGHVVITDNDTGEVLLDDYNALHPENLSEALCLSLGNRGYGHLHQMVFGNGASTISGTGSVTYFPPNSIGADAQLYNQTYAKIVDDNSPSNVDPTRNFIQIVHTQGMAYTDIIVTCVLERGEPSGQDSFDNSENMDTSFIFDEIGLKSFDQNTAQQRLLGHIVFNPVQKSLNRALRFKYSVRIYLT